MTRGTALDVAPAFGRGGALDEAVVVTSTRVYGHDVNDRIAAAARADR